MKNSVLFYDEALAFRMRDSTQFFVDGTFAVCPGLQGTQQFVTVMVLYYGKALPLFFILMEGKGEQDYLEVFKEIKRLFPDLKPIIAMLDFEKGFRNALRSTYTGLVTHGCLFHCFQALFRQAVVKGAAVYRNKQKQPDKHFALLLIMSLAYIPADLIPDTYLHIKANISSDHPGHFDDFFEYFENEWLFSMRPDQWSVYRKRHTTNNFLETYHRFLKKFIGVKPETGFFFKKMIDVIYNTWIDLYHLEKNEDPVSAEKEEIEKKIH